MCILEAFHAAGVQDALVGVIHDPLLAAEAHGLGEGARFTARFNRRGTAATNSPAVRRRGQVGGAARRPGHRPARHLCRHGDDLGAAAALRIGGITVVVISNRSQCADPAFLEHSAWTSARHAAWW